MRVSADIASHEPVRTKVAAPRTRRTGTQSIERALDMIVRITTRHRIGWRPSDLAKQCGLDRATTQRILACLVRARFVHHRPGDPHYLPGPMLFELGLALPAYAAFQSACQPRLANLARRLSAYTPLCVRSGEDSVCIAAAGPSSYRGVVYDVGIRRPLTATAAGIAILLALPEAEAHRVIARQIPAPHAGEGAEQHASLRMWRKSVSLGFGLNQGYTARGIHAVSVPLRDCNGVPFGSLTAATAASRLPPHKVADIAEILEKEAEALSGLAGDILPGGLYNLGGTSSVAG